MRVIRHITVNNKKKFIADMKAAQEMSGDNARTIHTIIFTKLLNYFNDELEPEWGGTVIPYPDLLTPKQGLRNFLRDVKDCAYPWIDRIRPERPWGPDNFKAVPEPPKELGVPYEHYLSCGAGLLTLKRAALYLGQTDLELAALKNVLLLDSLVVAECVDKLLLPRCFWPEKTAIRRVRPRPAKSS